MSLKGKIALVTGSGDGIGRAVAMAFAREGAFVILLGRTQVKLERVYDAITAEGGQASIAVVDLEKELPRLLEVAKGVRDRFGRLDILVNNAAQAGSLTPLAHTDPQTWERLLRVNVTAPFFLTQCLFPFMKGGSAINVTSSVGHQGRAYWGAYAASKAALINLTETWAEEVQNLGLRMNTVNPGGTRTTMRATAFPGEDPQTLPAPEDITPVFLYLASKQAQSVNGRHFNARDWLGWKVGDAPRQ